MSVYGLYLLLTEEASMLHIVRVIKEVLPLNA